MSTMGLGAVSWILRGWGENVKYTYMYSPVVTITLLQVLMDAMDPTKKQKVAAQKRAKQILTSLGISKDIKLNEYEMLIASQVTFLEKYLE